MKKCILFLLMSTLVAFGLMARRQIDLSQSGQIPHHSEQPFIPADQPDVYYDDDADIIIVDGTGYSTYYNVEITSLSTFNVMISTCVNGNYDTIDVVSLPDDDYEIVITSSYNNVFEGYFTM